MAYKNFDDALEASEEEQQEWTPVPFQLGGREWHLDKVADRLLLKWLAQANSASNTKKAELLEEILNVLVVPAEQDQFFSFTVSGRDHVTEERDEETGEMKAVVKKIPKPSTPQLVKVIVWAIEQRNLQRPTEPPSA